MNAIETETVEPRINVEEQARIVMTVLREYAEKLVKLNHHLLNVVERTTQNRVIPIEEGAWLLDQSEIVRKPLLTLLSRGSGLRENALLELITRDELSLRMTELEVHLHHMIRQTGELRAMIDRWKKTEAVAKLRVSAGLNAMKGGPLRPNE
jgi:hypothetical protein